MGRRRQCDSPATLIQMGMHRPHRPWGTGATLRAGPNSRESATSREHEPPQIKIKYKRLDVTRKRLQTEPASSKPVVGVRIADAPIGTRYDRALAPLLGAVASARLSARRAPVEVLIPRTRR